LTLILLFFGFSPTTHAQLLPWQKGVTLRLNNQTQENVTISLQNLSATNANWVAITPGWITESATSSNVARKAGTPTDPILVFTINKAHELGLKVMLKPHLDIPNGPWRGFLDPADTTAFFSNYEVMLVHYAKLAEQYNVEQLSVGAELLKITTNPANESAWRNLISKIRTVYTGKLTYSANADYGSFNETVLPFWDALDVVGLSMYRRVSPVNPPSHEDLISGWKTLDQDFVKPLLKYNKPIIFTEIGYRSADVAALRPWDYSTASPVNLELQKNLYTAMLDYWKDKTYFSGLHLWDWFIGPTVGGATNSDYTPQNKPAAEVLTAKFKEITASLPQEPVPSLDPLVQSVYSSAGYYIRTFAVGTLPYSDRSYLITGIPTYLDSLQFIRTRNGDKNNTSEDYLKFELNQDAFVLVAYDYRAKVLPAWLQNWQVLPDIVASSDTSYRLYAKQFSEGIVTLGGNAVSPMRGAASNYFVLISSGTGLQLTNPSVIESPTESSSSADTNTSSDQHELIVKEPADNTYVSGEKKLKVYLPNASLSAYSATYEVDGRGEVTMPNDALMVYKQAKIDFDSWNWANDGPYSIVIRARNLDGSLIDSVTTRVYVRH
jgi:hypothetical protein